MTDDHCQNYTSWMDHGVLINQCLEFYKGMCSELLSPHNGDVCPWAGYPCPADDGEGRWKAPLLSPDELLAQRVGELDKEVDD